MRKFLFLGLFLVPAAMASTLPVPVSGYEQGKLCKAQWGACSVGRYAFVDDSYLGFARGGFWIDLLFLTKNEISRLIPVLGDSAVGSVTSMEPTDIRAYVAPGSLDVVLYDVSKSPAAPIMKIGTLDSPVGTDESVYYARKVVLDARFRMKESKPETRSVKYCDEGAVFGPVVYDERFSKTTYSVSDGSQELTFNAERFSIKSGHHVLKCPSHSN